MAQEELKSIMHVDDDPDIRTIIKMALELVGSFEVQQYGSGQEALDNIDELHPQLMLFDMMMPEMTGLDLWRKLMESGKFDNVPVIFLTAKAEDEVSESLMREGALAVITKPIDPITLADQVRRHWDGRQQA